MLRVKKLECWDYVLLLWQIIKMMSYDMEKDKTLISYYMAENLQVWTPNQFHYCVSIVHWATMSTMMTDSNDDGDL